MDLRTFEWWFQRGSDDAARDRPRLFRSTRAHGIVPEIEPPDDWTDNDVQQNGAAYLRGYDWEG